MWVLISRQTCINLHLRFRMYTCIHIYACLSAHTYIYKHVSLYTYVYMCVRSMCICWYLYLHTRGHMIAITHASICICEMFTYEKSWPLCTGTHICPHPRIGNHKQTHTLAQAVKCAGTREQPRLRCSLDAWLGSGSAPPESEQVAQINIRRREGLQRDLGGRGRKGRA